MEALCRGRALRLSSRTTRRRETAARRWVGAHAAHVPVANWFNLGDEACEDALYDIAAFRDFAASTRGASACSDATTLLNFATCWRSIRSAPRCLPRWASCRWPTA